ncbi:transcriptional repressor [Leucobacter sp. OH2974_COT-288]|nr:transcriptional repressor [Leucobacter sp. OH2974_COT-288]
MTAKRNTWQREAVRAAMTNERSFISAQTLYDKLRAEGSPIGLATVYRSLSAMAEAGEADTINSPEGENLFRFCTTDKHHHHLICRSCGATEEIDAGEVESWAESIAAKYGYADPRHIVDIFGICEVCRNRPTGSA